MMRKRKDVLDVIHGLDGRICVLFLTVSHEAKSAASSGIAVLNHNLPFGIRGNVGIVGGMRHTASSTWPNSSNLMRSALSSVCHARPLRSRQSSGKDRGVWQQG